MPTYEMPLLLRIMNKPETFNALKRTATAIFDKGGIIRKIENLGLKKLPCKLSFRGRTYWEANHFLYYFDVPPLILPDLIDEYNRDIDILRSKIYKKSSVEPIECTLHEELLPPVYRKNVIKLMEVGEIQKKKHKKLQYDREMKYYPSSKPNQVS